MTRLYSGEPAAGPWQVVPTVEVLALLGRPRILAVDGRSGGGKTGAAASGDSLTAPMQGTIVKIMVEEGQAVEVGDLVVVLEAMKMEQPINAHKSGVVTGLTAKVGETVTNGAVIAQITD